MFAPPISAVEADATSRPSTLARPPARGARSAGAPERITRLAEELGRELTGLDPDTLAGADARDLVPVLARVERRAAAAAVRCGARAAAPTMARKGGERAAAEWLGQATGRTRRQAEAALHLAQVAHEAPATRRAWADGELTVDQAEQITEAVRCVPEVEDDLLALARRAPAEEVRREARKIVRDAREETVEERQARHHRRRRLGTWTNDDGEWEGRFATATTQAVGIAAGLELCSEAAFRRARREGRREPLAAHRLDGLELMAHLVTGGHPAELGYELTDLPAALRPPLDDDTDDLDDPWACGDPADIGGDPLPDAGDGPGSPAVAPQGALELDDADDEPVPTVAQVLSTSPPRFASDRFRVRGVGRPYCVLVVDLTAILRGESLPGERCEIPGIGPVPVAYARELLGEGLLRLAIRDGVDVRTVVHPRRRPNAHQLTALLARYDECSVSGCTTRAALQVDHDHPWADTHQTWLPNLKKVCPHHHARKTNERWDWVVEPPDPLTGKHRLVPPGHADHPRTTGATKPTPEEPVRGEPRTSGAARP
jgi:hypothetical protein